MDLIWDDEDQIVWGEEGSDDDEFVEAGRAARAGRREYRMRRRVLVEDFDDSDFFARFRLKKETALRVLQLIQHKLTYNELLVLL